MKFTEHYFGTWHCLFLEIIFIFLRLIFKTLDLNFLDFVFMFDCLYVCLTLSAYLFVFVCYPACLVCFAYNKFYLILQIIILF